MGKVKTQNLYNPRLVLPCGKIVEHLSEDVIEMFEHYYGGLEGQLYMAMEADESVITGCGKCRQCPLNSPEACKELACDYIRAQKDVMGKKFYHRVYYFG